MPEEFNMEKQYNPQAIEDKTYRHWEESGAFTAHRVEGKKPFTIVMPPPNITGQLHMGHAMDCTLQDALTRYHRMKGDPTLWLPGTDHASIATEVKVVEKLAKEGIKKQDIGREEFLKHAWDWKKEYGGRISRQLRRMGASCDWSRERFTMDEGCSKAVLNFSISRLRYSSGSPVYAARSSCGFSRILAVCSSQASSISEIRLNFLYSKSFATSCVRGSSATSALPSSGTARGSSILDLISSKAAASTINSDDTLTSVICMAFTCSIYCFTISEIWMS